MRKFVSIPSSREGMDARCLHFLLDVGVVQEMNEVYLFSEDALRRQGKYAEHKVALDPVPFLLFKPSERNHFLFENSLCLGLLGSPTEFDGSFIANFIINEDEVPGDAVLAETVKLVSTLGSFYFEVVGEDGKVFVSTLVENMAFRYLLPLVGIKGGPMDVDNRG
jgi:hypothetical protein